MAKSKKLRGTPQEKMLLTTRLMTISLLVDDYIYKNKPISLLKAVKLNEEIAALKLKCEQDARSLQVVEKLKRFMKNIIKEQSIDKPPSDSSDFVAKDVYTTHCSTSNTNCINKSDVKQIESHDIMTHNDSGLKQISEREDNIRKTLINDLDKSDEKEFTEQGPTTTPTNLQQSQQENISVIQDIKKSQQENICLIQDTKKPQQENICLIQDTKKSQQENICLIQDTKKSQQENICCIQDIKKPDDVIAGTKINEIKTKVNKKTPDKSKITAKNITKIKKGKNKKHENKISGGNKTKNKRREKTQINLSWVENLKYVREVSSDEHTDLQVEDSFWSNLTLPGSWNQSEFDLI